MRVSIRPRFIQLGTTESLLENGCIKFQIQLYKVFDPTVCVFATQTQKAFQLLKTNFVTFSHFSA